MKLPNGDILPAFLNPEQTNSQPEGSYFGNFQLFKGEVVDIIYPNDSLSLSKKYIEYNVYVDNRSNGTGNGEILNNCVINNDFAGLADKSIITLRKAEEQPWKTKSGYSNGSKVLVLCVNGESSKPVIIGGLRDVKDDTEKNAKADDPGLHALWIYNGINTTINKDGELSVEFKGPTKNNGELDKDKVQESATGTKFSIDKEGNAKLATKDDAQFIQIDHKNKKVLVKEDQKFEIGEATDAMVLGTTQRRAEQQMHNKITSALQTLSQLALNAGIQLNAAAATAVTPALAPLKPGLTGAAAALNAMQAQINNIKSAIDTYESNGTDYISTKCFLD